MVPEDAAADRDRAGTAPKKKSPRKKRSGSVDREDLGHRSWTRN